MAKSKKGYHEIDVFGVTWYESDYTGFRTPHEARMLEHVAAQKSKKAAVKPKPPAAEEGEK